MLATQEHRLVQVKSPLGRDALLFAGASGTEQLSMPFTYDLGLLSEAGDIDPERLLGDVVSLEFPVGDEGHRYLHGIVTDFAQVGAGQRFHHYQAILRPWLWLLTRASDCRVFQKKSVPEIFEAVVSAYGSAKYRLRLKRSYPKWEYCVQYRETDFNFVSRLLEQEGIYYYFEHTAAGHEMILVDDPSCHDTRPGYATVPYFPPGTDAGRRERDHLTSWAHSMTLQSGAYALNDFDFEQPRKALSAVSVVSVGKASADLEMFDYPAELQPQEASETARIAKLRIEELMAARKVARGSGNAMGLVAGARFRLEKCPRADLNAEYLITSATLSIASNAYQSGIANLLADVDVSVAIEAIEANTPFRPARMTPKPVVQGAQTAIVVGKQGEEIWTDEYGRVKVQFHWDRAGKRDENSSCWVRVAQLWAGEQWGAIHIPRIGQEVIVSFLEGDPDQPIITGRVYNGACKPPYALPENQSQSGIKSRSTKGGGSQNFNELRFEDKKGEEQIYVHAERDLQIAVENDRVLTVDRDEHEHVKRDRQAKVDNNETLTVGKSRSESVGENDQVEIGKRYVLDAGDEIVLRAGSAELMMKKDGTIVLKGVKVTIDAAQSLAQKAGQKVEVKGMEVKVSGTRVQVQGTLLDLKASGISTLKGALTKIG